MTRPCTPVGNIEALPAAGDPNGSTRDLRADVGSQLNDVALTDGAVATAVLDWLADLDDRRLQLLSQDDR